MRLDKYISNGTDLSRTQVKRLAKSGAISVNGELCRNSAQKISDTDRVELNGKDLSPPQPRYFMLNKPEGYICATHDGEHPTVLDLLDEPRCSELQIAGRLDIDTTGLVLITDDGQWNHAITAPNRQCPKLYQVTTARSIAPESQDIFSAGLWLEGEKTITEPAKLNIVFDNEAELTLHEGRYHQVKRMFAATGNHVESLHRASIGKITLDHSLALGEYRLLSKAEIESVLNPAIIPVAIPAATPIVIPIIASATTSAITPATPPTATPPKSRL